MRQLINFDKKEISHNYPRELLINPKNKDLANLINQFYQMLSLMEVKNKKPHEDCIVSLKYAFIAKQTVEKKLYKLKIKNIIAGLRPAFTIFKEKLNDILGQACRIAFGPDREEDTQGARDWQIKTDLIAASIVIIAFLVYLINFLIWLF